MFALNRHIRRALDVIFSRWRVTPEDVVVTMEAPTASNDNGLKARPSRSSAGVYSVGTGGRSLVIHACLKEAAEVGLNVGDRVAVEMRGDDFIIRPAANRGATIVADKTSLVIRAAMRKAPLAKAVRVTLSKMADGAVLVRRYGGGAGGGETVPGEGPIPKIFPLTYLNDFKSLAGKAGKGRWKFLAANDNDKLAMATTTAGDQCYTPQFLVLAILRAALRKMFDIDCCSMLPDGRYDRALPAHVVAAAKWRCRVGPGKLLQVIGAIPARRYMTKDDSALGSLLLPWIGEFIWLNPPYSNRLWAVFLEKAAREVAAGRAGIIVALVPMDTSGEHIRHMYDANAYRIELAAKVPFFKLRTGKKDKKTGEVVVRENVIEDTRGNSLVVFGQGTKTRDFLLRLLDELLGIGFITEEQASRHREEYWERARLQVAA